jgi:hypothetical protein
MVSSVILAVYLTNAVVVYEKEQKVLRLLEQRKDLLARKTSLQQNK